MEKNQLQQRVIRRLSELKTGAVEAAERVPGLERNYIRDLVNGKKQSFSQSKLPLVAQALDWSVPDILGAPQHSEGTVNQRNTNLNGPGNYGLNIIPRAELVGDVDLPVHAIVQGGRGVLVLENEPFTHTTRPKRLVGVRGSYGVLVKGNSMAREYSENDIAYVDPNLHPRAGDPCVFQGERADGSWEALIKYLERSPDASETLYYVSQTNPEKKFTIKKADWQKCHVAVGKESGR